MKSDELLELYDLLQQQAAVIEQQTIVISKLIQVINQYNISKEFSI